MTVAFEVEGVPQPKGSTKGFRAKHSDRIIITNDNPKTRVWAKAVWAEAEKHKPPVPLLGPVFVTLGFRVPRPKRARATAVYSIARPDLDKLVRAVLDALTWVMWYDDAQVAGITASKLYADAKRAPGVSICLYQPE